MAKKINSKSSRTNLKKASEHNSVKTLKVAEAQLAKAQAALERATTKLIAAREKAQAAAEKARNSGRANLLNNAKRAKDAVTQNVAMRQEAAAKVRLAREDLNKAKQQMRAEEKERKMVQRKEAAKQKAVTAFIKKWEREWDRKNKARRISKQSQVRAVA